MHIQCIMHIDIHYTLYNTHVQVVMWGHIYVSVILILFVINNNKVHYIVNIVHYIVNIVHYILYIQYTLCISVQTSGIQIQHRHYMCCIMYVISICIRCTVYIVHYTLSVQCTVYSVHYTTNYFNKLYYITSFNKLFSIEIYNSCNI